MQLTLVSSSVLKENISIYHSVFKDLNDCNLKLAMVCVCGNAGECAIKLTNVTNQGSYFFKSWFTITVQNKKDK